MNLFTPQWSTAPATLALPRGTVHIWRVSLDVTVPELECLSATLSPDEQQRAARFRFERDRRRFTAGRGALRAILGRYLQVQSGDIQFCYSPTGKPAIANPAEREGLAFNLSHSQDWMVCAVTCDRRVGIDLEGPRSLNDLEHLTRRFFAPAEHQAIQALPPEQQLPVFFQYWTCKEALLKATGEGLSDLATVALQMTEAGVEIVHWTGKPRGADWEFLVFYAAAGFTAAIALENPPGVDSNQIAQSPVFWQWQDGKRV